MLVSQVKSWSSEERELSIWGGGGREPVNQQLQQRLPSETFSFAVLYKSPSWHTYRGEGSTQELNGVLRSDKKTDNVQTILHSKNYKPASMAPSTDEGKAECLHVTGSTKEKSPLDLRTADPGNILELQP